jgi:hypothetical protein
MTSDRGRRIAYRRRQVHRIVGRGGLGSVEVTTNEQAHISTPHAVDEMNRMRDDVLRCVPAIVRRTGKRDFDVPITTIEGAQTQRATAVSISFTEYTLCGYSFSLELRMNDSTHSALSRSQLPMQSTRVRHTDPSIGSK